jgi:hypothetical protein
MNAELSKAEILSTFERGEREAAEFARANPGTYVVCFDDTTPFRVDDEGGIALFNGGRIFTSVHKAIAQRLALQLHEKAVKASCSSAVVALRVESWAKQRIAHFARLAQFIS